MTHKLRNRGHEERKIVRRPRGYVLRIEIVAEELAEAWDGLTKEERLERLEFIREAAEFAYEQAGGAPYWTIQGPVWESGGRVQAPNLADGLMG